MISISWCGKQELDGLESVRWYGRNSSSSCWRVFEDASLDENHMPEDERLTLKDILSAHTKPLWTEETRQLRLSLETCFSTITVKLCIISQVFRPCLRGNSFTSSHLHYILLSHCFCIQFINFHVTMPYTLEERYQSICYLIIIDLIRASLQWILKNALDK